MADMNLLILGGTRFVGRHVAEAALDRGWKVSVFHRGKSNPDILPDAEHILGDRLEDLSGLAGKRWDFAVDTSAYFPRAVQLAGEALKDSVGRMAFISTISVYAHASATSVGSPVATVDDPSTEEVTGETYGGLKALCEEALSNLWGKRCWIVRPGIIAGPYDPTDRFTYWVDRVANYSAFVPPARLWQPIQALDGLALGEFLLDGLLAEHTQTVNAVGPQASLDFEHLLNRVRRELRGAPYELLERPEGMDLPLELPVDGSADGLFQVDPTPALEMGLKLPSIRHTIRATYDWWMAENRPLKTEPENSPDIRRV